MLLYSLYEQNALPIIEKQTDMTSLSDEQFWNMPFERKNATAAELPLEYEWISTDVALVHRFITVN